MHQAWGHIVKAGLGLGEDPLKFEGIGPSEGRAAWLVFVIAAERVEADACVVERLGEGGPDIQIFDSSGGARCAGFVGQVADLDDELDSVVDELLVEVV